MPAADAADAVDLSDFDIPSEVESKPDSVPTPRHSHAWVEDVDDVDDAPPPTPGPLAPLIVPIEPLAGAPLENPVVPEVPPPQRRSRRTQLEMLQDSAPENPVINARLCSQNIDNPVVPDAGGEQSHFSYTFWTTEEDGVGQGDIMIAFSSSTSSKDEPGSYKIAMKSRYAAEWTAAIKRELSSLTQNKTFGNACKLPAGRKAIGSRFVFKIKRHADGSIERFKARLVAKGFSQIPGLEFGETFSPVVKWPTLRIILALAAKFNLDIHQLDYETAYLNGVVSDEHEMYLRLPIGFNESKWDDVLPILRSIYGLKQAGRVWNQALDKELTSIGWTRCSADSCLYVMRRKGKLMILAVYVDDLLLLGDDPAAIRCMKTLLGRHFKIKDLGEVKQILGVEIQRDRSKRLLSLSQSRYIREIYRDFGQAGPDWSAKPASTPLSPSVHLTSDDCPTTAAAKADMANVPYAALIGKLLYLVICTRPDIAYAVGALSKFLSNPGRIHWKQALHVLRYVHTTIDEKLTYDGHHVETKLSASGVNPHILGYTDSDWAGDLDTCRSTGGYVFMMCGGAVTWSSKRHSVVTLSSTEAEYTQTTASSQELLWITKLFNDLFEPSRTSLPIKLLGDNQGSNSLAKNPGDHPRTKHIAIKYHFCREVIASGAMILWYCPTAEMVADVMTKALGKIKHRFFASGLGLKS